MNFGKTIRKFRRNTRAISPVIATLLMIAIAVVASLVTYAWVMGYMNFTTRENRLKQYKYKVLATVKQHSIYCLCSKCWDSEVLALQCSILSSLTVEQPLHQQLHWYNRMHYHAAKGNTASFYPSMASFTAGVHIRTQLKLQLHKTELSAQID